MPHPIIIPLLMIPHVAIPAGLAYVLYLDHKDTITRIKAAHTRKRKRDDADADGMVYVSIPPPPKPSLSTDLKTQLEESIKNRHIRKLRQKESPTASVLRKTMHHACTNMYYRRIMECKQKSSPLSRYLRANCKPAPALEKISYLIDPSNTGSYNCHSPMRQFAIHNCMNFKGKRFQYLYKRGLERIYNTPMRTLASTPEFQMELECKVRDFANLSFSKSLWSSYYYTYVVRKIPNQYGKIMSPLAACLKNSCWYSNIDYSIRQYNQELMKSSPMHKMVQSDDFQDQFTDSIMLREAKTYYRDKDPIRLLTKLEKNNIQKLARQMRFRRELNASRMHKFVMSTNNRLMIALRYISVYNLYNVKKLRGPLSKWTDSNREQVVQRANEMMEIRNLRSEALKKISDALKRNYGSLYRKYVLKTFRTQNGIPEVKFKGRCTNYASIVFPPDMQIVDRFLAESNLDGFIGQTIYTSRNHYRSYATSLLTTSVGMPSINDLTDAAQTFKNISHLTEENTQVQILSDSDRIVIPPQAGGWSNVRRHVDIYFVRRDRNNFRSSDHKSVISKVSDFLKRYPDLNYEVGYVGRWLGDTMLVSLTGPEELKEGKYTNLSTDLIQVVNLIKGIIFQKVVDRTCWIHLPPMKE